MCLLHSKCRQQEAQSSNVPMTVITNDMTLKADKLLLIPDSRSAIGIRKSQPWASGGSHHGLHLPVGVRASKSGRHIGWWAASSSDGSCCYAVCWIQKLGDASGACVDQNPRVHRPHHLLSLHFQTSNHARHKNHHQSRWIRLSRTER